jgi:histidinol-phosphate aminotransferase
MTTFRDLANPHLFEVAIYEPGKPIDTVARELGLDPARIDKLASNENFLGCSPKALTAMRKALRFAHIYPDGAGFELRAAIARKNDLEIHNIVLGSGSEELLQMLGRAFLAPGTEGIMADRGFAIYRVAIQMAGAKVVEVPLRNQTHDLEAMARAITPRTRMVFIANPNNPTGTRVRNEELDSFLAHLPHDVIAVVDEAYYEFLDNPPDTIKWIRGESAGAKVVALRTFSKIVGLAGLRIGYGLVPAECADVLQRVKLTFNTNAIAQAGALAALSDDVFVQKTRRLTAKGRVWLEAQFKKMGLEYVPSVANFVLVRVGNGRALFQALQKRGVIVRPMDGYRMPEWVRVTVGTMHQNRRFIRALKEELSA